MKKVKVYQSETDEYFDLELVGLIKYTGEEFWGGSRFTDGKIYQVVRDRYDCLKVVDNRNENYVWGLLNAIPMHIIIVHLALYLTHSLFPSLSITAVS